MAAVEDLCIRNVAGYAFSNRIDIQPPLAALDMALHRARPNPGLIFHSDRGVQYAAAAFQEWQAALEFRQSMPPARAISMTTL